MPSINYNYRLSATNRILTYDNCTILVLDKQLDFTRLVNLIKIRSKWGIRVFNFPPDSCLKLNLQYDEGDDNRRSFQKTYPWKWMSTWGNEALVDMITNEVEDFIAKYIRRDF
jgi:hypothetical protein